MEKSILVESIRYSAVCQGCGAEAEWCGVQALVGEALRWDVVDDVSGLRVCPDCVWR